MNFGRAALLADTPYALLLWAALLQLSNVFKPNLLRLKTHHKLTYLDCFVHVSIQSENNQIYSTAVFKPE